MQVSITDLLEKGENTADKITDKIQTSSTKSSDFLNTNIVLQNPSNLDIINDMKVDISNLIISMGSFKIGSDTFDAFGNKTSTNLNNITVDVTNNSSTCTFIMPSEEEIKNQLSKFATGDFKFDYQKETFENLSNKFVKLDYNPGVISGSDSIGHAIEWTTNLLDTLVLNFAGTPISKANVQNWLNQNASWINTGSNFVNRTLGAISTIGNLAGSDGLGNLSGQIDNKIKELTNTADKYINGTKETLNGLRNVVASTMNLKTMMNSENTSPSSKVSSIFNYSIDLVNYGVQIYNSVLKAIQYYKSLGENEKIEGYEELSEKNLRKLFISEDDQETQNKYNETTGENKEIAVDLKKNSVEGHIILNRLRLKNIGILNTGINWYITIYPYHMNGSKDAPPNLYDYFGCTEEPWKLPITGYDYKGGGNAVTTFDVYPFNDSKLFLIGNRTVKDTMVITLQDWFIDSRKIKTAFNEWRGDYFKYLHTVPSNLDPDLEQGQRVYSERYNRFYQQCCYQVSLYTYSGINRFMKKESGVEKDHLVYYDTRHLICLPLDLYDNKTGYSQPQTGETQLVFKIVGDMLDL